MGFSYVCPVGSYGSAACKNYFAGAYNFRVADYEVFAITAASVMLSAAAEKHILAWVAADLPAFKGAAPKLERCYSMAQSGDGGSAHGFHAACDSKGPTVTVVKTTAGFVFGGVADKSWAGAGFAASSSAFMFCLSCSGAAKGAPPHQLKLTENDRKGRSSTRALYRDPRYGPVFGAGTDLKLVSDAGKRESSAELGFSYACPAGSYGSTACKNYLAGALHFTLADYEVFVLKQ